MSTKKKRVVVTGFGPFDKYEENVSWKTAKALEKCGLSEDVELVTKELPVVYDDVLEMVPKLWEDNQPHLTVHMGVSGVSEKITIESQAFNGTYKRLDVKGNCPPSQCCIEGAPDCVVSELDICRVTDAVNNHECKASAVLSKDPGQYLCDFSFYLSLNQNKKRAAFIHLPPENKPYSVEELTEGVKVAILALLDQVDCS